LGRFIDFRGVLVSEIDLTDPGAKEAIRSVPVLDPTLFDELFKAAENIEVALASEASGGATR